MPLVGHVDLVLTDIPFNVNLNYLSYSDNLTDEQYGALCKEWFLGFKKCSDFFIVKAPTKTMPIVLPVFHEILGYVWSIIQHSPNAMTHGPFNLSLYTQYLVGGKLLGKRPNSDYFVNTRQEAKSLHPAGMPIYPIQKLIDWFTEPEHVILDPFLGSGTTLAAAKNRNRKSIGIEIEEKYCEVSVKRLRQGVIDFYGTST
jgi:hypothetical protein